ncbi:MAG: 4a-hydroxytetrahydrobiopterin dehydratase [Pseudomonadota bacterium]|nr:4a-hydroxytetrahydrobiopterin dehydratase [Pseudomonadota bacterium]
MNKRNDPNWASGALKQLNKAARSAWTKIDAQGGQPECIHKQWQFDDFIQAFGFMSQVALLAETQGHHPDWSNSYAKVDIRLSTHDQGGLSEKDFALAQAIEALSPRGE